MKTLFKIIAGIIIFFLLTLITQVGGIIWLMCLPLFFYINSRYPTYKRWLKPAVFLIVYCFFTFVIIPPIAGIWGRKPLPFFGKDGLKPLNRMTCLLNRHYVRLELETLVLDATEKMRQKYPGSVVAYMDANHPFYNGYPLIPHISNSDGKKLDIAFFWKNAKDEPLHRKARTFIGYGGSENPNKGEYNTTKDCEAKGYWQYGLMNKIIPKANPKKVIFDLERNRDFMRILATHPRTGKILIEPHLEDRLGLRGYNKVRFHGCHAVRHDDHLHLQL